MLILCSSKKEKKVLKLYNIWMKLNFYSNYEYNIIYSIIYLK